MHGMKCSNQKETPGTQKSNKGLGRAKLWGYDKWHSRTQTVSLSREGPEVCRGHRAFEMNE